jgi:iron complex outermembrane receptor protein
MIFSVNILNKGILFILFVAVILNAAFGQKDTSMMVVLNSAYVTDTRPTFNYVSKEILDISDTEIRETGSRTLSEALSTLPGISQLTTGPISKPVIRGLYGSRIRVNVAGVRLEDQQWEDEYGLGLTGAGVEYVELIKGPASLLYGSNALGGVVNVVEEDFIGKEDQKHNINLGLFSNSYGVSLDYGFRKTGRNVFMLRTGVESHADYSDGDGNRVPNTRFALYNMKLGYLVDRPHFRSENRLLVSYNQFGFIADTSEIREEEDESRLSREFEDDHQNVFSSMISSINTYLPDERTEWEVTASLQNNLRQEQERSDEPDLYLLLNTASLKASLGKRITDRLNWTNGISGMLQSNTNLGSRIIVPDATIAEGSVYSYLKYRHLNGTVNGSFETGLRYDHRHVVTHETGSFNSQESDIPPFSRGFNDISGSVGESIKMKNLLLKINISTGFRSGDLAELAANGLHEGTTMWYRGNPDMRPERCIDADFSAAWQHKWLIIKGSVFNNWFTDYIYLQPTDEEINGYDLYRYQQDDAVIKGFEAGIGAVKEGLYRFSLDYSYLDARRSDGTWLPMIPANRLIFEGKYFLPGFYGSAKKAFISAGATYTTEQDHTDEFENPTPGYVIINAGAGVTLGTVRIMLTCRNLTDKLYFDHLSRLKYYGLYDMGRNIVLNVGWRF